MEERNFPGRIPNLESSQRGDALPPEPDRRASEPAHGRGKFVVALLHRCHGGACPTRLDVAADIDEQIQSLLDFEREFDVDLYDRVVLAFFSGRGDDVRQLAPMGFGFTNHSVGKEGQGSLGGIPRTSRKLDARPGDFGTFWDPTEQSAFQ